MFQPNFQVAEYPTNGYWYEPTYYGYSVNLNHGPLMANHLAAISRMLANVLSDTPRAYAVRFDLRLPAEFDVTDTEVITRFFNAFRRLLEAADQEKTKEGKRVHPHRLRYCWAREWGDEGRPHYHVLIILNHDRYRTLGAFKNTDGNLAARIKTAWAIATGQNYTSVDRLIHFPNNPEYRLIRLSEDYQQQLQNLFYRVSYFAKAESKVFGIGQRTFGTSMG
ncbi:MAG: inovirus Gp2 family protein [Alishewanella aestuarii]